MSSMLSLLLYLGLYLSQRIQAENGSLPKPILSIKKDLILAPGGNVTLMCNLSNELIPQMWTYLLLKDGNSEPLQRKETPGFWVEFSVPFETIQDLRNYSCKYFGSQNPGTESEVSMVDLEIWEKDPPSIGPSIPLTIVSRTTLIILGSITILFFIFLLAFFCRQCLFMASGAENIFLNVSGSPQTGSIHEYEHGHEETDPSNSGAEDEQGVTYSQLNIETLAKGKLTRSDPPQDPIFYSTVAWHQEQAETHGSFGKVKT